MTPLIRVPADLSMILRHAQRGLTAVEYAVMGGIVVVALVAALVGFSPALNRAFGAIIAAF